MMDQEKWREIVHKMSEMVPNDSLYEGTDKVERHSAVKLRVSATGMCHLPPAVCSHSPQVRHVDGVPADILSPHALYASHCLSTSQQQAGCAP